MTFKGITSEPLPQRESLLLYFKYLGPPPAAVAYAPPHHRPILERIYQNLEAPAEFRTAAGNGLPAAPGAIGPPDPPILGGVYSPVAPNPAMAPPSPSNLETSAEPSEVSSPELGGLGGAAAGDVAVSLLHGWGAGVIRVRRVGADTAAEVRRARQDLCDTAGAEVVYLELPLAQSGTPAVCAAAEADGFFFSGLGPRFAPDGDALRLQFLNTDLDLSRQQIASPFGRELLDYVAAERARVGRG
jgi:hypothetical protein